MKNRVIKLSEKSLESLVNKIIKEEKIQEALPRRERERHETNWRKKNFEPYDRERDIMGAFGPYSNDVPPNVISYLRKNPRTFLQRVVDIYGMDKVLDFIGYQQPEMTEGYDNYMGESTFNDDGDDSYDDYGPIGVGTPEAITGLVHIFSPLESDMVDDWNKDPNVIKWVNDGRLFLQEYDYDEWSIWAVAGDNEVKRYIRKNFSW